MRAYWRINRELFVTQLFLITLGSAMMGLAFFMADWYVALAFAVVTGTFLYSFVSECLGRDYWFFGDWYVSSIKADKDLDKRNST